MPVRENDFLLQDRTATINKIENQYGLINQLGLFGSEGVTTRTFQYDVYEDGFGLAEDRAWGSKRDQFVGKELLKTKSFPIPHFPLDGHIKPSDIQSRRAVGTDNEFDTKDAAVARELARIRNSWAQTKEWAMRTAIVEGRVYAPNGTVDVDYYSELGETRKEVDFVLGTDTTKVGQKSAEVIAHIQDNLMDGMLVDEFIGLASPEFFEKLIDHPEYVEAYNNFESRNSNGNYLRDKLGVVSGTHHEVFRDRKGITWIKYRGQIKGAPMIPANEAYVMPRDLNGDYMKIVYAPADRFDAVNPAGGAAEQYAYVYEDERGRGIDIETESNMAPFIFKPQVVVKCTTSN